MGYRILVCDDERDLRESLCRMLCEEGYEAEGAADGETALAMLPGGSHDLVLLDLRLPGKQGLDVLTEIAAAHPETGVIIVTAYATVETAVLALTRGAFDYLLKPLLFEDLLAKIRRAEHHRLVSSENRWLRREIESRAVPSDLTAVSPAILKVKDLVARVAPTRARVLIVGESGTGKEVVARAIHALSPGRNRLFVPVNMSAIPDNLLESHLFGHIRGAFTGADREGEGLFRAADGGTLFLDEIGEMPLNLQPKLLRAIEDGEILPVGATRPVRVSSRLIAATHRDLAAEVEAGRFREDLYHRLKVVVVRIPPLRERPEDIPVLAEKLIERHAKKLGRKVAGIDPVALRALLAWPWKGNVRELENVIERALILGEDERIGLDDLPEEISSSYRVAPRASEGLYDLRTAVRAYQGNYIKSVLAEAGGDKKRAAELLGLSLSSLYRHLGESQTPAQPSGEILPIDDSQE